jgi:DNA transformation protein and related proteins
MRQTPADPLIEHLRELLAPLGPIRVRRMFGGWGLYCDQWFFALVADDRFYLKADEVTEAAFIDAGSVQFEYVARSSPVRLRYWSAPDEALDSADAMAPWARRALEAARRAQRRP